MEQDKQTPYYIEDDEITLKELILKIKEMWAYLWARRSRILIAGLVGAALFVTRSLLKPTEYQATLTFMVDEDNGGGGAVAGILSKFGFGGAGSEYNLQKILSLSKSMRIMKAVVLDTADVDGKTDLIGNHIIELYEFRKRKSWKKPENHLTDFAFGRPGQDSLAVRKALKAVIAKIVGGKKTKNQLFTSSADEDSGIMTLSAKTESADLSLALVKSIFEHLSGYYILKSTEKAESTFEILKSKTDSIYSVLTQKEYALAQFRDKNRGIYLNKIKVREQQLQNEITALRLAWAEALKNQEMANYVLKQQTPFIQPIDVPFAPLEPVPNSLVKAAIIGAFLGGFLMVLWLLGRKVVREALEQPE